MGGWQTPGFKSPAPAHGRAGRCQVWRGRARPGEARDRRVAGRHRGSSPRHPRAWQGWAGPGRARSGMARDRWRVTGRHRGSSPRHPRTAGPGKARSGLARRGMARDRGGWLADTGVQVLGTHARLGAARQSLAGRGEARDRWRVSKAHTGVQVPGTHGQSLTEKGQFTMTTNRSRATGADGDIPATMTTTEAAETLKVHRRTVLRMIARGQLRGFRLNNWGMRVYADDVRSVAATGVLADSIAAERESK